MTSGPKRTPTQREADLQTTASLYLRGVFQSEIAKRLHVSQAQISIDLKTLRKRWLESSLVDIDQVKAKELARIDETERQAWRGWRRSVMVATKTMKMSRQAGEVKFVEAREEQEKQVGDPRFLTIVLTCIERRCKIFGLDAAIKISWQEQAKADGYDPDTILSGMESAIFTALVQAGASGSLSASRGEDQSRADSPIAS